MDIVLFRTFLTNIGNGFIEKGARIQLEQAFPEANVTEVSGYPNLVGDKKASSGFKQKSGISLPTDKQENNPRERMINAAELMDPDLIVVPGCILTQWFPRLFGDTFNRLSTGETPVIFLGAGGNGYSLDTQKRVNLFLKKHDIDVLITRDQRAYEAYKDTVPESYNGIDCAYWIDEWYEPPEASTTFVAHAFDKMAEPEKIATEEMVVRPRHDPLDFPHSFKTRSIVSKFIGKNKPNHENELYSDILEDYLFVYANAEYTHSDRVHACIPTLVYGGKAQFHYDTPRSGVFDRVDATDISKSIISVDSGLLHRKKSEQINRIRESFNDIIN